MGKDHARRNEKGKKDQDRRCPETPGIFQTGVTHQPSPNIEVQPEDDRAGDEKEYGNVEGVIHSEINLTDSFGNSQAKTYQFDRTHSFLKKPEEPFQSFFSLA